MNKKLIGLLTATLLASSVASATVVEGVQENSHMKLSYPLVYVDNQRAQHRINTTIADWVVKAKRLAYNPLNQEVNLSYRVMYEGPDFISIILTTYTYTGGAHGMYSQDGIVFDTKTGRRLPLSYFVHIKNEKQLTKALRDGTIELYNQSLTERLHLTPLNQIGWDRVQYVTDSYYLGGDGIIYLIYPPYELGPFSDGATRIKLTPSVISQWNRSH